MTPRVEDRRIWLLWLTRLRWVALFAQVITLGFAWPLLQSLSVLFFLSAVMVTLFLANLRALSILASDDVVSEPTLWWQLGLDIASLTGFFLLAGGPSNPFTLLYVIHVAMGAVMLSPRAAITLSGAVLVAFAGLHLWHLPLAYDNHTLSGPTLKTLGTATAFAVTIPSVAVFVVGLANALRRRTAQLLDARDRTSRTDRLRMVGTLAAGAAHELNTPLSTLGLRIRRLQRRHPEPETMRDLEVMKEQMDRCSRIVQQLLAGAGDPSAGGFERVPLTMLVREGVKMWETGSQLQVQMTDTSGGAMVNLPRVAFSQALTNLLENAREAQETTGTDDPLDLTVSAADGQVTISLRDHGCGLPEAGDQVGTPFFTTKATGTGLGVYVASQVADGAGGSLRYSSHPIGTTAHWSFPVSEPPSRREQEDP